MKTIVLTGFPSLGLIISPPVGPLEDSSLSNCSESITFLYLP
ncbi:MAG: hypothetical protein QW615_05180 [Desulfurococcaceae archaeon]